MGSDFLVRGGVGEVPFGTGGSGVRWGDIGYLDHQLELCVVFWLDGDVSDGMEVLLDVGDGGVGQCIVVMCL